MRKSKPHTKTKGKKDYALSEWEEMYSIVGKESESTSLKVHSPQRGLWSKKRETRTKEKAKENCSWVWCQPNKSRTRPTPNPTVLTPHPRNGWFHRYSRRLTSLQFLHPLSYKYAHLIKEVCTILWYFTSHFDDYIPRAIHILLHKQRGKFQGTIFSFTTNIFLTIQKIRGNYWKLKWYW